jgi:glycosyltransferase involved in cell wall biosynthesis
VLFHTQVTSLFSVGIMRRLPAVVSLDATPINYDSVGHYYHHRAAGDGLLDRQKYRINRSVFHAAAGLVTWSEWARRSLEHDYGVDPAHVRVLAPGASPAFFEIGARRAGTQEALPPSDGDRLVRLLFVGGDFERKGGPLLVESMRGPLGERCELHLVTGAELGSVPRNVHVHRGLGPNSAELLGLFAEADVFVLPTLADCLPLVLMEATAAGLPVVTTDVGALREAVIPGTSGMLVPPADAGELVAALERLVGDAALRRQMGRAGRELAQRKFDAHRNTCALLELLVEKAQGVTNGRNAA